MRKFLISVGETGEEWATFFFCSRGKGGTSMTINLSCNVSQLTWFESSCTKCKVLTNSNSSISGTPAPLRLASMSYCVWSYDVLAAFESSFCFFVDMSKSIASLFFTLATEAGLEEPFLCCSLD